MEILAKHLGLEGASTVKTLGDKNDTEKTFGYRDVDGEENGLDCEAACYVDELFMKRRCGASQGRISTSPLMRKEDPSFARWADIESDDGDVNIMEGGPAS